MNHIQQYLKHTGNIAIDGNLPCHYKKIGNNLVDLFLGDGWNTPSRYRLVKGAWVYQQGPRLSDGLQRAVLANVAKG